MQGFQMKPPFIRLVFPKRADRERRDDSVSSGRCGAFPLCRKCGFLLLLIVRINGDIVKRFSFAVLGKSDHFREDSFPRQKGKARKSGTLTE